MAKPVCAVVGVGPGNGEAFARRFSREGYAVALMSRTTAFGDGLAKELGDAKAFACDVTDAEAIHDAFAAVHGDLGPVDVLLYNAGSGTFGPMDEVSPEDFERSWRVNAMGLFLAARAVVGPMREKGAGAIIVTGATASLRGKPFTTAFAAAKAAQRSLAESLARQLDPEGIHVALVIVDGVINIPGRPGREANPEKYLEPDDIAATVYHLATQPRSAWSFQVDVRPFGESW